MASAEGQQERVLNALFTDAMSVGAIGLTGRIQPSFQQALADNHCVLTARQTHTLIHARDPAILEAVKRGDMALTMIDGEGPLQLWNNPSHGLAKIEAMKSDANVHYLNNTETRSAA